MKKRLIIVIVIVCVAAIGIVEWKTKKSYTTDVNAVKKIVIAKTLDNVRIRVSKDDQIHISYSEGISYDYVIKEENNVLTIKGHNNIPTIILDLPSPSLSIEIPKDYGNDLSVYTKKQCSLDKAIKFNHVKIKAENNE